MIADGTWQVGADITPGTYRARGDSDNIEENGGFTANVVVTQSDGQCGDWSG